MAQRKSGLGRGLESLIPSSTDTADFAQIAIEEVRPNPNQPRTVFDEESISSLSDSIIEVGLLQPIVVRPADDGGYLLVAGERRWRAAKRAGLHTLPAVIRHSDDAGALAEALVENLQRRDLSPLEEAAAFNQLLEDFGMTHEELAGRVGRSRPAITNTLRLLALPAAIQGMLERGELSAGHARALLGIDDRKFAEHIAGRAVAEGWSVRQVEDAVRLRQGETQNRPKRSVQEVRPVEIIELEHRLRDQLGSKVQISYRNHKGRVQIDFASLEELERIYRRFFT